MPAKPHLGIYPCSRYLVKPSMVITLLRPHFQCSSCWAHHILYVETCPVVTLPAPDRAMVPWRATPLQVPQWRWSSKSHFILGRNARARWLDCEVDNSRSRHGDSDRSPLWIFCMWWESPEDGALRKPREGAPAKRACSDGLPAPFRVRVTASG